jgi:hypothetical protein
LNGAKGGVARDNVKVCSQLRLMEKRVWNKVRGREKNIKIKKNK